MHADNLGLFYEKKGLVYNDKRITIDCIVFVLYVYLDPKQ